MNIGQHFVEVDARILPAPSLQYKEGTQPMNTGSLGAWNLRQVPQRRRYIKLPFSWFHTATYISQGSLSIHACKRVERALQRFVLHAAGVQQACQDPILGCGLVHQPPVYCQRPAGAQHALCKVLLCLLPGQCF